MKLNIRTELLLSFALVLLLVVGVNIYGLFEMDELANLTTRLYNHPLQVTRAVLSAHLDIIKMHHGMKDVALSSDEVQLTAMVTAVDESEKEVYRQLAIVQEWILGEEGKALAAETSQLFKDWKPIRDEVISLMRAGKQEEAVAIVKGKAAQHVVILDSRIGELRDYAASKATGMYETAQVTRSSAITTVSVALLVSLGIGGAVGFLFARSISRPIVFITQAAELLSQGDAALTGMDKHTLAKIETRSDELGAIGRAFKGLMSYFGDMSVVAERLSTGDLTVEVAPKAKTDLLGHAFNQMQINLRQLVGQVSHNAGSLNSASTQLAAAAHQAGQATSQVAATIQQMAQGTAQQMESVNRAVVIVEQVTKAIDGVAKGAQEQAVAVGASSGITNQIAAAIQQVANNAESGAQGAATAAQNAREGAATIEATIKGIANIKAKVELSARKVQEMGHHSDQIGVIVETIDDIASQTNLLALNAAIEAARAGEHGKGFAVVADEVRKLAEKSATATKEIAGLINSIQRTIAEAVDAMNAGATEVETGVKQANQAGRALTIILQAAEDVHQQVAEIAIAVQQMRESAGELVSATDTVSMVVEENTAATEEMAASSGEVTQAIENIAGINEENGAAVEEVSASAEELNAQVEEVTASAQSLADMAQALQTLVDQFTLADTSEQAYKEEVPPVLKSRVAPVGQPVVATGEKEYGFREKSATVTNGRH